MMGKYWITNEDICSYFMTVFSDFSDTDSVLLEGAIYM
jgi:hypothetical protein